MNGASWNAEKLLSQVEKPGRYTGGEMNTDVKEWGAARLHFGFCFPDTYEIGMSHLGMKILYEILNSQPDMLCERFCMPWIDMADLMRRENTPLFSLENRRALSDFDVVGFTLQYEMSYTNILEMLDLGGIPVLSADRKESDPIVVAGGPCAFNSEPLCDFIDAVMVGDGEEVIITLSKTIADGRESGLSRSAILRELAKIEGVYVPSLYEVAYNGDGTVKSIIAKDGAPERVKKCVITDLDHAAYPEKMYVPYSEIVFDRIMLEIMRGCTRGCRFCQAGILYRPVRERSKERLIELADKLVKSTGYEEISLSSLSSGDYSCLPELAGELIERFRKYRVSISLPSLRLDSVVKQTLEETQKVKKSSLTFAPEAGTQRLRDVINKGVTKADLVEKATDAFMGGWSSVKLYFMMGLPTETNEDLDGIGELAAAVRDAYFTVPKEKRAKGLRITCSASVFVPKPFTPFQWVGQDSLETVKEKQAYLRGVLAKEKGVNFNWHEPELSFLEATFSRGDRKMSRVLYEAWKLGCRLDGWNESFSFENWMKAFENAGVDPDFYALRERSLDEVLPWSVIDCGVTDDYLKREWKRAVAGEITPDCRKGCQGCGLQRWGVCGK